MRIQGIQDLPTVSTLKYFSKLRCRSFLGASWASIVRVRAWGEFALSVCELGASSPRACSRSSWGRGIWEVMGEESGRNFREEHLKRSLLRGASMEKHLMTTVTSGFGANSPRAQPSSGRDRRNHLLFEVFKQYFLSRQATLIGGPVRV